MFGATGADESTACEVVVAASLHPTEDKPTNLDVNLTASKVSYVDSVRANGEVEP